MDFCKNILSGKLSDLLTEILGKKRLLSLKDVKWIKNIPNYKEISC